MFFMGARCDPVGAGVLPLGVVTKPCLKKNKLAMHTVDGGLKCIA